MVSTSSSVSLRSYLLLPLFLWYALISSVILSQIYKSHTRLETFQMVTIRIRSRVNGVSSKLSYDDCVTNRLHIPFPDGSPVLPWTTVTMIKGKTTDLNYWIKLLSCIIEANGGHIGLSHINLHWYYWGSRRGFYRFRLLVGMDKHCVNEISFTNNFCFFWNLPVNNELGIVQDGRHEFIIKCFKPSQNH